VGGGGRARGVGIGWGEVVVVTGEGGGGVVAGGGCGGGRWGGWGVCGGVGAGLIPAPPPPKHAQPTPHPSPQPQPRFRRPGVLRRGAAMGGAFGMRGKRGWQGGRGSHGCRGGAAGSWWIVLGVVGASAPNPHNRRVTEGTLLDHPPHPTTPKTRGLIGNGPRVVGLAPGTNILDTAFPQKRAPTPPDDVRNPPIRP